MPTNTRTPSVSDGICAPTPSDLAGTLDNIVTRLENIERDLARLKNCEFQVANLAYISPAYSAQNNALAVSMLPAGVTEQYPGSAWVTAYGTISGIRFSDDFFRNLYGGTDGVMRFPVGSPPTPGAGKDTIVATYADSLVTNDDIDFSVGGGGEEHSDGDSISLSGTEFTLSVPGLYLISVHMDLNGGAGVVHEFRVDTVHDGMIAGFAIFTLLGDASGNAQDCKTIVVHKTASDTEGLSFKYLSAPAVTVNGHVNITKLSGL
jgi:hypothetical protein